jgi:LPXTG-motif cell wall-anchored protein
MTIIASVFWGQLGEIRDRVSIVWHSMGGTGESLAIFGALGLATLLALVWAIYFRKRRRRHAGQRTQRLACLPKRKGRLRREHRRRNPTLAETRGLPPVRAERHSSVNS